MGNSATPLDGRRAVYLTLPSRPPASPSVQSTLSQIAADPLSISLCTFHCHSNIYMHLVGICRFCNSSDMGMSIHFCCVFVYILECTRTYSVYYVLYNGQSSSIFSCLLKLKYYSISVLLTTSQYTGNMISHWRLTSRTDVCTVQCSHPLLALFEY